MHKFISMMFSLLVIIGLQVSAESAGTRPERSANRRYISEMTVPNGRGLGSWGYREMCPGGTYAAGFSLKVENIVYGTWDNTALNAIRLHCIDELSSLLSLYHDYASVQSEVGSWGRWTDIKWCPSGFLTDFVLQVKPIEVGIDNTAANNIMFRCSDGSFLVGEGTYWGNFGDWSKKCEGKGICGIKTRIEEPQGAGDDTALNDVIMYCCD
ncbi:vitelline membrane outer layer protein 1-like [Labeo rohita]|uniref:vitelline membrane outer layer protein 1-like n=1 Tax=Labeo rohita TaxID=84645 RepID=UPI0021E31CE0|nr:vitelline membrane outer layer protein 1-like [Labeo rohita]